MASKSVPGFGGHAFSNLPQPFMLFPFLDERFGFNSHVPAVSNSSLSSSVNNITLSSPGAYPRISSANGTSGQVTTGLPGTCSETRSIEENINSLGSINGNVGPLSMKRNSQIDNILHNSVSYLFF